MGLGSGANIVGAKGRITNPTSGVQKGSKRQMTMKVVSDIIEAYEKLGGVDFLYKTGLKDPKLFVNLLARILPSNINQEITSPDGSQVGIRVLFEDAKTGKPIEELKEDDTDSGDE